jgi:hypothetical protein
MRPPTAAVIGLVLALQTPTTLPAQAAFQGSVTYRINSEGQSGEFTMMSLGSKVRMEMAAPGMPGPMVMLMDGEKMVMQVVMASAGMYMEMDMNQAMQMVPESARGQADAAMQGGAITKLDTTDEVVGIPCQNYRFANDGDPVVEACIASGMGYWMGGMSAPRNSRMPLQMGPDFSGYMKDFENGMVPLRVRTKRGETWSTVMEDIAVERKTLDPSLFTLPSGLQKMPVPAMGGPPA